MLLLEFPNLKFLWNLLRTQQNYQNQFLNKFVRSPLVLSVKTVKTLSACQETTKLHKTG